MKNLSIADRTRWLYRVSGFGMLIFSITTGILIIFSLFNFMPKRMLEGEFLVVYGSIASLSLVLWKSAAARRLVIKHGLKKLAIIGDPEMVSTFIKDVSLVDGSGFVVSSVCFSGREKAAPVSISDNIRRYEGMNELLKEKNFDALCFDSINRSYADEEIENILGLKFEGKIVHDFSAFYEKLTGKVLLTYVDGYSMLGNPRLQGSLSPSYLWAKRLMDIVLSSFLIVFLLPLFVLIAVLVKLESEGPVLFTQERLGVGRKPFKCLKFRTMVKDAEKLCGPVWASKDDPRISRVGKFLRRSRLDELPQLVNIVKGDMTFVGPRPIRQYFAQKLEQHIPFYSLRFCIKPGLTGWAQVRYDYAGSKEGQVEKFQYDLFYIHHMSLVLDLLIMLKTLKTLFKRSGQ